MTKADQDQIVAFLFEHVAYASRFTLFERRNLGNGEKEWWQDRIDAARQMVEVVRKIKVTK